MKRFLFLIAAFLFAWVLAAQSVNAANVTLQWDAVDFESCGSDPLQSGYMVYKSSDEGETKSEVGRIPDVTQTSYSYDEDVSGKWCYYLTAFNQVGMSEYSDPACGYIANCMPNKPINLNINNVTY